MNSCSVRHGPLLHVCPDFVPGQPPASSWECHMGKACHGSIFTAAHAVRISPHLTGGFVPMHFRFFFHRYCYRRRCRYYHIPSTLLIRLTPPPLSDLHPQTSAQSTQVSCPSILLAFPLFSYIPFSTLQPYHLEPTPPSTSSKPPLIRIPHARIITRALNRTTRIGDRPRYIVRLTTRLWCRALLARWH
jgi:hypothetical protein